MSDEDWRAIERAARVDPAAEERRVALLTAGRAPADALVAWRREVEARNYRARVDGADKAIIATLEDVQRNARFGRLDDINEIKKLAVELMEQADRWSDAGIGVIPRLAADGGRPWHTIASAHWKDERRWKSDGAIIVMQFERSRIRRTHVRRDVVEAWAGVGKRLALLASVGYDPRRERPSRPPP
jgi:hypothetical protein